MKTFKKLFLPLIFLINFSSQSFAQISAPAPCDNLGFVDGDLSDWKFSTGCHPNAVSPQPGKYDRFCHKFGNAGCCPIPGRVEKGNNSDIDIWDARHTLMGGPGTNIVDKFGKFNVVPPEIPGYPKSNYSVRLGNAIVYGEADQMERTFQITEDNAVFAYQFKVVFNDPIVGHDLMGGEPYFQLPFFEAGFYDENDALIVCTEVRYLGNNDRLEVLTDIGPDTVNGSGSEMMTVRYREWTPVFYDLTDYIGKNLTLRFKNSDCARAGHWGYSYVSAFCGAYKPMRDTVICKGEPVTLKSPFPIEGFDLEWSTGETTEEISPTPDSTTTYTLKVRNKFSADSLICSKEFKVKVSVIDGVPHINREMVCKGNRALIKVMPQGGMYSWFKEKNGGTRFHIGDQLSLDSVLNDTVFYVMGNCLDTTRIPAIIKVYDPKAEFNADKKIAGVGDKIQFTNQFVGGKIFNWNFGDGTLSNLANPIHSYKEKGIYSVSLFASDSMGCSDSIIKENYIFVDTTTGIAEVHNLKYLKAYPNPTGDILNLGWETQSKDQITIELIDLFGKVHVQLKKNTKPETNHNQRIDLKDLPKGVYLLRLKGDNTFAVIKIFKE